ncbi:MAG TPA: hypothetical protein VLA59_04175 [Patescibacteria group bacterium]|nr:hypothetical protein [Patescibacteria group bacterium]
MPRLFRPFLAVAAALAFSAVPIVSVMACSCMETSVEQAVAEADLAIVGTLVAVQAPPPDALDQPMAMEWAIERSRDALDVDRATIIGWPDNGANCGVSFEVGERWLVLASMTDAGLETHGCLPNRPLDADDPESAAIVDAMPPVGTSATPEPAEGGELPLPLIAGGGALALLAALSLLAFRRRAPGES